VRPRNTTKETTRMSIRYVATVLDKLTELSATDTLVLIALADFASDDTRECWPSVATIARRARVTRRAVQLRLRSLEKRGLIQVAQGGHFYGRNTASQYRLCFDHDGKIVADLSTGGRTSFAGGANVETKGGERRSGGGEPRSPHPLLDPSLNQRAFKKRRTVDKSKDPSPAVTHEEAQAALTRLRARTRKSSTDTVQ
jgi:hypothetical protein